MLLKEIVLGSDPLRHAATLQQMLRQVRNLGETGIAMMAISAIDNALWDLAARLLDVPLVSLLGQLRTGIPVYGSGGFTTYTDRQLADQLGGWAAQGFTSVKMKIGTHPDQDPARVHTARQAVGSDCNLFVDANGAYTVTQAIELAHRFADDEVRWFEEPVSSDHLTGLSQIRERAPFGMDIAAGEYGYTAWYFRSMLAGRSGHRAAGRLHALRWHQWISRRGCALLGAQHSTLVSLRPQHASSCLLRRSSRGAYGVLSRPRTHRTHLLRRLLRTDRRMYGSRPISSRNGAGTEGEGCSRIQEIVSPLPSGRTSAGAPVGIQS